MTPTSVRARDAKSGLRFNESIVEGRVQRVASPGLSVRDSSNAAAARTLDPAVGISYTNFVFTSASLINHMYGNGTGIAASIIAACTLVLNLHSQQS
jgi:hypothetical protein